MNKKGLRLMTDATIRIIISAICIFGLVSLGIYIYSSIASNHELDQAKGTLNNLLGVIDSGGTQIFVYGPKSWFISSFPLKLNSANANNVNIIPKACSSVGWKSCICIYKMSGNNPADAADSGGACQRSDFVVNGENIVGTVAIQSIKIDSPPVKLSIDQSGKTINRV